MPSTQQQTGVQFVKSLAELTNQDTAIVGGKNASLGEMISVLSSQGVRVPGGFATTAEAYRRFIKENSLRQPIAEQLERMKSAEQSLEETGKEIRRLIEEAEFPSEVESTIRQA